ERRQLLETLVGKYPEFFGKLDIEKTKNEDLLSLLNQVNGAYEKRIALASGQLAFDTNSKNLQEAQSDYIKNITIANAYKRGDYETVHALEGGVDKFKNIFGGWSKEKGYEEYMWRAGLNKDDINKSQTATNMSKRQLDYANANLNASSVFGRASRADLKTFGGDKQAYKEFINLWSRVKVDYSGNYTGSVNDINQLKGLLDSAQTKKGGAQIIQPPKKTTSIGGDASKSIASGGTRPTTINLTIHKLQDQTVIKTVNLREGAKEAGNTIVEEILMALNSVNAKAAGLGG
ncbi:MAG: hypothetical protein DI598_19200, partial [Pseudopedobacter saltans]